MTFNFPWASLLRGVLGHDDTVLAGVSALAAPGATISALVSVVPRDGVPAMPPAGEPGHGGGGRRVGVLVGEATAGRLRPSVTYLESVAIRTVDIPSRGIRCA